MTEGLRIARTTPEFTHESTPLGLRRAHKVADDVWGRLCARKGELSFVFEDSDLGPVLVTTGNWVDIPPDTPHHVVTSPGSAFVVEFWVVPSRV